MSALVNKDLTFFGYKWIHEVEHFVHSKLYLNKLYIEGHFFLLNPVLEAIPWIIYLHQIIKNTKTVYKYFSMKGWNLHLQPETSQPPRNCYSFCLNTTNTHSPKCLWTLCCSKKMTQGFVWNCCLCFLITFNMQSTVLLQLLEKKKPIWNSVSFDLKWLVSTWMEWNFLLAKFISTLKDAN